MIVYSNNKKGFFDDVRDNIIADKIEESFKKQNIKHNNFNFITFNSIIIHKKRSIR